MSRQKDFNCGLYPIVKPTKPVNQIRQEYQDQKAQPKAIVSNKVPLLYFFKVEAKTYERLELAYCILVFLILGLMTMYTILCYGSGMNPW